MELIETQFYAEWHKRNVFQIPPENCKKTLDKFSCKNKRMEKSVTTDEHKVTVSANPRARNQFMSKKSVMKEERNIGTQGQIESLKTMSGASEMGLGMKGQMELGIKGQMESRGLFKPLNLRIRNVQIGLGNR